MNKRESYGSDRRMCMAAMESERMYMEGCVEQLFQLSLHDPIVRAHLDTWRCGRFRSLEEMLCHLVIRLSQSKEEALTKLFRMTQIDDPQPGGANKENDRET